VQGTAVGGTITTTNAPVGLGAGTSAKGDVKISGGGPICIDGTSSRPVQVGGSLTIAQLASSSTVATICSTSVNNNLSLTNSAEPVIVGGSSSCAGNSVTGTLTVQGNSGRLSIGAAGTGMGNTMKGSITVSGNTGGGMLTNNSTSLTCTLQNDTPGIVGSLNTAKGTNTCNRTA
jgi:hypothetical protein